MFRSGYGPDGPAATAAVNQRVVRIWTMVLQAGISLQGEAVDDRHYGEWNQDFGVEGVEANLV